ncbi:signal transduction histidine kinase [Paenibacillus favisporus]|uniref:Signal transduction histidine kinase n=1 Tax=Paenibacillus favisporus TaxID=221028 RepID=A0ABV2EYQ9_9BACL
MFEFEPKWYWISLIMLLIIVLVLWFSGLWKYSMLVVAIMNGLTSIRFWKEKEENRHIAFLIAAVLFLLSFFISLNKP